MLLGYGEFLIDTVVALALIVGGTILLGVMYDFVSGLGQGPFVVVVLELLSGLLLVFIFTELITTIRVVIARRRVVVEPDRGDRGRGPAPDRDQRRGREPARHRQIPGT